LKTNMRVIQLDEVDTVKKTKICSIFTLKLAIEKNRLYVVQM